MLLCIDIGNTHIKLGLFAGTEMRQHWRIATNRERQVDEYAILLINLLDVAGLRVAEISGCAISSVVPPLTPVFCELAERYLHLEALLVGPETPVGMAIQTDYPAEVGPDLIVNALAARARYGAPVIVIGFGTATTFVAVNSAGDFEGVAIAPGIVSAGDSLFRSTSTLPQVALARPARAVGKNTVASLRAGLVFGFAGLVKELVGRIRAEIGAESPVVVTGGLALLIAPELGIAVHAEPDLALEGLRLVWQQNCAAGGQSS